MRPEVFQKVRAFLQVRKRNYQLALPKESPPVQAVLADLARFCRADRTTFHPDPRIHAALEGRREVWLRISNHLELTPDQLVAIYAQKGNE